MIRKDLTGKRYNNLVVVRLAEELCTLQYKYWECTCDCGNTINVLRNNLHRTQSCGCASIINLTGQRFTRLVVLNFVKIGKHGAVWNCQCDCGNTHEVSSNALRSGNTKSCGCLNIELVTILGKNSLMSLSNEVNGIKILGLSNKRSKHGATYCFAECPFCKNTWEVLSNRIRNKQVFSCRRCRIYLHSTSKPANTLLDLLEKTFSYELTREFSLGRFFFDAYIPELNLLIESDGSYWHSSEKAKINDIKKETLAIQRGYRFVRVTNDGAKDIPNALEKISNYIKNECGV